ncbi:PDZ domain-containing protein [Neiella marina]|uniref:PDZ domain-containing protein n=1 Tax=Neiella holothuriorum TaxID=2870530 RepID=A0ABS7EHN3_9GAMM|nr:PDZ domain-containing protein [Neiella holothuriorum]MBW8191852.1 PDZ domain-containing protein [Neiella holothuriorum]
MLNKILVLLTFLVTFSSWGQTLVRLTPVAPQQHLLQVELIMQQVPNDTVTMTMPIWRTGRYQQLDFAHAMTNLEAADSAGNKLEVTALSDHQWQLKAPKSGELVVRYQLTADELAMRTRHLDESHLFADFASVVLAVDGMQQHPYEVELIAPKHWQIRSGLAPAERPNVLLARDYQTLIDSPIEAGEHELRTFYYQGALFELVVWGHTPADLDQLNDDIKKLVVAAYELWGKFPFEKYVFMVHATDNIRGGTEHLNSTIMQWDRFKFNKEDDYMAFLGLVAHEFVHTWNVKAYRPAAFVPYDLTERHHSTLLWLAEGSTSYLQDKLLLKSGLIDNDKYYQRIAKRLAQHQATPGGFHQSVADASWYSWNQRSGQHRHNCDANIYQEGYAATLALDLWMLEHSAKRHGVAALHRQLYEQYSLPNGLTVGQVQTAIQALVDPDADVIGWWQQHVDSPLAVDWERLLANVGLTIEPKKETVFHIGASIKPVPEGLSVSNVSQNSAAWEAGLTAGDRIVAVDGFAVNEDNYTRMQHSWAAGQTLELHLFRQGILTKRTLTLAEPTLHIHKLAEDESASSADEKWRKAWLDNR